MGSGIEDDRVIGPVVRRMHRWFRVAASRVSSGFAPEDRRNLDPITVNYCAWREMRRHVREWPRYREAPNYLEVLVSPEDWDDYWGVDTKRKEEAVAVYVCARAAERGYWIAGRPQVTVVADDAMVLGDVEVECRFVKSPNGEPPKPARQQSAPPRAPMQAERVPADQNADPNYHEAHYLSDRHRGQEGSSKGSGEAHLQEEAARDVTVKFVSRNDAGEVYLIGDNGLRLCLRSGDCVGAIAPDDDVPMDVSIRLPAAVFPYAESKHFSIGVIEHRWCVINHASSGTKLITNDGNRFMLLEPDPYPLNEGDKVFLGPLGPLRFEYA